MNQGHQNWVESVKLNGGYHHEKFQRSLLNSLREKAYVKVFDIVGCTLETHTLFRLENTPTFT